MLIFLLISCDVVKFQEQELYSEYEKPKEREKIDPIIFDDNEGTMWNSLFDCGKFKVTNEVAYTGSSSIKISWDKSKGCEWIGFGNSFSNWAPTNMSKARYEQALSMFVRTQEKTSKSIPIIAALEDFSGGGSYHYIDAAQYLHGLEIDTTWKQIIVPLWHFPISEEEIDIYSIKQMQFQLEGAGSFYIDQIKLIDYTEDEYQKMREDVELMKPEGKLNQQIYTSESFDFDAWGVGEKICHKLEQKTNETTNQKIISWDFDARDCNWAKWGLNWNDWYQINLRRISDKTKLVFKYESSPGTFFKFSIEDFNGHSREVFSNKTNREANDEIVTVEIPLKELKLKESGFLMDQIKQLLFEGISAGNVTIHDIYITKTSTNE